MNEISWCMCLPSWKKGNFHNNLNIHTQTAFTVFKPCILLMGCCILTLHSSHPFEHAKKCDFALFLHDMSSYMWLCAYICIIHTTCCRVFHVTIKSFEIVTLEKKVKSRRKNIISCEANIKTFAVSPLMYNMHIWLAQYED